MLSTALLAVAVTAAAAVAAPSTAGAASTPADEAVFLSKINELRGSLGLAPLTPDPALAATSCTWNDQLIVADALSHDPNLSAAIASVEPNWRKGGENVGMGGTVVSLFDAFVASPGHYKNLVDPEYSRVGICAARSASGKLFTTHRFLGVGSAPATPPPTSPPPHVSAAHVSAAHVSAAARAAADHAGPDRAAAHTDTDTGPDRAATHTEPDDRGRAGADPRARARSTSGRGTHDSGPVGTDRGARFERSAALDRGNRVGGTRIRALRLAESGVHGSVHGSV